MAYRLYMALVAYYTGFFNTPKSLQLDLDLSRSKLSSEQQHELAECFRAIIDHRLDFCKANLAHFLEKPRVAYTILDQMLQSPRDELEGILSDAIAENELKRLLKRRSRKGHESARGSKVAVPMIVDEDVEMAYY